MTTRRHQPWIRLAAVVLIVVLACVAFRWHNVSARSELTGGRESATRSGISIMLNASQPAGNGSLVRATVQDAATISVGRDCPATPLDDGSIAVTATISSAVTLSAVTVIDDVGTANDPADDVVLTLQYGDQNGDGALDPGETWTLSGAFVPGDAAVGDTITATGTDADSNAVSGTASCEALPNGAVVSAATPPITANPDTTTTTSSGDFHAADVEPTVTINKTGNAEEVNIGDQVAFDLSIGNDGEASAFDLEVNDQLPPGADLDWEIDTGSTSANCAISGDVGAETLSCTEPELSPGEHVVARVFATPGVDDCGTIDNQAQVRWALTSGGDLGDWLTSPSVSITIDCPAVVVEKVADPATISAGEDAVFKLTVSNPTAEDSYASLLSDDLPTGFDWQVDDTSRCNIYNGQMACLFEGPAPGNSVTVTLTAPTTADNCGQVIENTARVDLAGSGFAPAGVSDYKMAPLALTVAGVKPASTALNQVGPTSSAQITVQCTDVTISKAAEAATISAGDNAVYTLTVQNNGSVTAHNVTVSDDLPTGPDWQLPDNCEAEGNSFNCLLPDIEANGTGSITLTGTTNSSDCGTISNSASVSASNEASADSENNDSESVDITVQCADLTLSKTADPATISAGDTAKFVLTIGNDGPGDAVDLSLYDPLPGNLTWTPDDTTCSTEDDTLNCDFDRLASGETKVVTLTALTTPSDCGTIVNTGANVYSPNEDEGLLDNNDATASIIVNCPDVVVTKTATSDHISAGDEAGYTISVHNQGAGAAHEVSISDTLPVGVDWQTPEGCQIDDGVLSCALGDVAADGDATITVLGTADGSVCDQITNSASVSAENETGGASENNDSEPATITIDCADLTLEKTADPATINAGDTATFHLTVGNEGVGDAVDVTLSDPLPEGFTWTPDNSNCTIDDGTMTCHYDRLASDATNVVTITAPTGATDCGPIVNSDASVSSPNEPEGATDNNGASATISVGCPDLSLTKSAVEESVTSGDPAVFTIVVTNEGDGIARGATLTDDLPNGIDWAVDHAGCSIAPDTATTDQVLSCTFGDLESTSAETVIVSGVTSAANCGPVANSASAAATNEADDALTNNHDDATITVVCPQLSIAKVAAKGDIAPGDDASYTITVTNGGDGPANSLVVTDDLPADITWAISPATDGCGIDGARLRCTVESLAAGGTLSVTVTGATANTACGQLTNTATVSAANSDAVASDPATISVNCPAGLVVTKTADADEVAAGVGIGFTMTVTNNGLGATTGVTLSDDLPTNDGLDWSIDTDQTDDGCQIANGTLACDFGTLDPQGSRTVHIVSPTTDASCGTVSNTVTGAATNEAAADQADDTATATITITCTPAIAMVKTATDGLGTEIDAADVGDTITYLYDITNTGGVPLSDITLTDDHFPNAGNLCPADTTLAPNDGVDGSGDDEIICTADYLVGETDTTDDDGLVLTNTATVSGQPAVGDAVTATDDATLNINEVLTPCGFPVTFTFTDDIPFTTKGTDDVAFTLPAGLTLILQPGDQIKNGDDIIGCDQPFIIAGSPSGEPVLATGRMKLYLQQSSASAGGLRALASDATLVVEVTEVTSWSVASVPAPKPEVGTATATITVSGPVLQVEAGNAEAVITVEPELEIPPTKKAYTISKPVPPTTGTGPAMTQGQRGVAGGLLTLLPLLAVAWVRRRMWSAF